MEGLKLGNLNPRVAETISPFLNDVLGGCRENMHSIHVVGSALTEDFDEKASDVNSIFVLRDMDLKFLEVLAPLGARYSKRRIAAPLIMTPAYIRDSADVFPLEFLSFRLVHEAVYGEDILSGIEIHPPDLRSQCEREVKVKLIGLRQGYLSSMGDARKITDTLVKAITGYIPLFRGIIMLKGMEPPVRQAAVLKALAGATGVDCGVYEKVLREKKDKARLSRAEVDALFEEYYKATAALSRLIDEFAHES